MRPTNSHLTNTHNAVADIASAFASLGTWGLPSDERDELLAERRADLDQQLGDPARNSTGAVLGRAFRTLLGDIGRRLTSQNNSALPLAISLFIGGMGTILYAGLITGAAYRASLAIEGVGLLILAVTGVRSPLVIRPLPNAVGALILASGMALGAVAIPTDEAAQFAIIAKIALALASFSLISLAAGLLIGWHKPPRLAGMLLRLAALLLAFSEIGWVLYVADKSIAQVLAGILTAAAAILFFRFLGRLRHLPIQWVSEH